MAPNSAVSHELEFLKLTGLVNPPGLVLLLDSLRIQILIFGTLASLEKYESDGLSSWAAVQDLLKYLLSCTRLEA